MKLKQNWYDILVNIICIGLLIGIIIYLILRWDSIPDKIPGHYNAAGAVDRWGDKKELLILPIITSILYILLTAVENLPKIWNTGVRVTEQNKKRVYRTLKKALETEKLLMVAVFSFITINSSLSRTFPTWFLPVSLLLVFGSLIFFLLKLTKSK